MTLWANYHSMEVIAVNIEKFSGSNKAKYFHNCRQNTIINKFIKLKFIKSVKSYVIRYCRHILYLERITDQ